MPIQQPTLDDLIQAMIQTESNGRTNAVGKKGELGLLQIEPKTAKDHGITDPRLLLDPKINKAVGMRIFSDLLKKYRGNVRKALEAYNAGRGRVDKGRVPASSIAYADKVIRRADGSASTPASTPAKRLTHGPQGPAFSPNMMLEASPSSGGNTLEIPSAHRPTLASGGGDSLRERLLKAFAPASADAAEPPNTLEIPSHATAPRAVDTAIDMKLRGAGGGPSRAPSTAYPSTAAVDARIDAKLHGGASTTPAKPLPLAVRAADWLPMAGQIGGELGGGALGIESGPGDIAAIGAGGGIGEGLGELADADVRKYYGLPRPSAGQFAKDAGTAGLISGGGAAITPVLKLIAPSKLKAAIEASHAYKTARAAAEDVTTKLRNLLGMDADTALQTTLSLQAKADLTAAYAGARRAGFDQISKVYQDVLGPYFHRMTPNASAKAFSDFANKHGAQSVRLLDGGIDFTRPTVRMIQVFRSNVAKAMRQANMDRDRALLGDLYSSSAPRTLT